MTRILRFEWEVPETVFDDQFQEETFLAQLKVDAVCKLFTAGRLSSGCAASLLGITRRAFFDLLQQHPYSQNIRTRFPTGVYVSITAHISACLLLDSYPYSAS